MILKAACQNNVAYIDRLITTFMKVMHKMAREHLQPTSQEATPSQYYSRDKCVCVCVCVCVRVCVCVCVCVRVCF